jgi:hypothetical protein
MMAMLESPLLSYLPALLQVPLLLFYNHENPKHSHDKGKYYCFNQGIKNGKTIEEKTYSFNVIVRSEQGRSKRYNPAPHQTNGYTHDNEDRIVKIHLQVS